MRAIAAVGVCAPESPRCWLCEDENVMDPDNLPTGVVTFLFTDVVDSTRRWEADREAMAASLRLHDEVIRSAVELRNGYVFSTAGDSFAVAFQRASDAVAAAIETQAALTTAAWPGAPLAFGWVSTSAKPTNATVITSVPPSIWRPESKPPPMEDKSSHLMRSRRQPAFKAAS